MGIPFEKLAVPRWGGEVPAPVERGACRLGALEFDPPVVLAPMAAVTNPPFRRICREMGAGLVVTEMIYARGLVMGEQRSWEMLDLRPEESPVSVQLYGKDPQELAKAAAIVEEAGAQSVDLNMGCPMRKVVSSGHGAALLRQPAQVYEIFKAMSEAVSIPVTGKIRAGWSDSSAVEVARAMEDGGAAGVTIHARTRCDFYDGHADLEEVRALKEAVSMTVIGNGDVCDYVSARRMFSVTGCDAVMVARGCLGNPWAFAEIAADLRGEALPDGPTPGQKAQVLRRHARLYAETFGEERMCLEIRKHLLWYFRGGPAERFLRGRLRDLERAEDVFEAIEEACVYAGEPALVE